jgi:hypothetical protein
MPDPFAVVLGFGRWVRNTLVLLAWAYAAILGFTLASCTSGDPFSWALLILFVFGAIGWPVTALAVIGALVVALVLHRPDREGVSARVWLRTAVAVTVVVAIIGAAAGFGEQGSCTFSGGF